MFYPLITARNLALTLSQLYLNDSEYIQKSTNVSFSFIIILFLIYFKPFKDRIVLMANIASEIMILALFFIILMKNIIPIFKEDFYFDYFFVSFILFQFGFEYLLSLFSMFAKIREKCKIIGNFMRKSKSQKI